MPVILLVIGILLVILAILFKLVVLLFQIAIPLGLILIIAIVWLVARRSATRLTGRPPLPDLLGPAFPL